MKSVAAKWLFPPMRSRAQDSGACNGIRADVRVASLSTACRPAPPGETKILVLLPEGLEAGGYQVRRPGRAPAYYPECYIHSIRLGSDASVLSLVSPTHLLPPLSRSAEASIYLKMFLPTCRYRRPRFTILIPDFPDSATHEQRTLLRITSGLHPLLYHIGALLE